MSYIRTNRNSILVLLVIAACTLLALLAPAVWHVVARAILSPFGMAFQLTTVLFAFLPALGLAWFAWHLLLRRRVRLRKLRRLRMRQGRTDSLLAPPPIFGAAYKKADHAIDRDRSE
jgi:hypothetical protein